MATSTEVDPYRNVVGQTAAREFLTRAAADPTNAYLIVGPSGSGKLSVAKAFAADVLSRGLDEAARTRVVDLVLDDMFADCMVFGAQGSRVRKEEVGPFQAECYRKPVEGSQKVAIGVGFDAITPEAAASLLKVVEEPGSSVIIVLLAEDVDSDLLTIASRCVRVNLVPLTSDEVLAALEADPELRGVSPDLLSRSAEASAGDLHRARVFATDERFPLRLSAWAGVPTRLDGTGAVVSEMTADLLSMIEESLEPLKALLAAETEAADAEAERYGSRRETRRQEEERHKRILRRARDAEFVVGLAVLAGVYRDAAVAGVLSPGAATSAVAAIDGLALDMVRTPNMRLQLQALFLGLPPLASSPAGVSAVARRP